MAPTMATLKAPYDPVKSVDGMFNGSIKQIAYVFKEPTNYGPSTKVVLGVTSKKFQDALDDCEIQMLDAKWYLEHQLALNKARREAKAQEEGATAAKRKLDEIRDLAQTDRQSEAEENPAKRMKVESQVTETMVIDEPAKAQATVPDSTKTVTTTKPEDSGKTRKKPDSLKPEPSNPPLTIPKAPPDSSIPTPTSALTKEGLPKSTPLETPANEVFTFESMFGEPTADGGDETGPDINFDDLDLNPDSFGNSLNLQDSGSLGSLLPGLETYANQAGDDSGFNFGDSTINGGEVDMTDNYGLPEIGNSFDAFLNDDSLGGNLDGDDLLNDDSIMNLGELDSFFN